MVVVAMIVIAVVRFHLVHLLFADARCVPAAGVGGHQQFWGLR
jgi:hypothetical protein